jgi:hypothetical protein
MDEIKEAERDYDSANSLLCDRHSVGINKCMVATVKHRSKGFFIICYRIYSNEIEIKSQQTLLGPLDSLIFTYDDSFGV